MLQDINDQGNVRTPITIYTVEQGYRYRFRIIGAGSQQCAAMITFQDHPMLLISTDGYDVVPVSGRTLWVRPGMLLESISLLGLVLSLIHVVHNLVQFDASLTFFYSSFK